MIESDLVTLLKSNTDITDIVGASIYPMTKPQNGSIPYITYQIINENNQQCIQGEFYQEIVSIQIDCWSLNYGQVLSLKNAVKATIQGWKNSYGIYTLDDFEHDTKLYRRIINFNIKE